jgi:hypothetical protein
VTLPTSYFGGSSVPASNATAPVRTIYITNNVTAKHDILSQTELNQSIKKATKEALEEVNAEAAKWQEIQDVSTS